MTTKWFVWSKSKATAVLGFKPMSRLNNGHPRRHSVSFSARQRSNGTPSGGKDEMEKKAPTSGKSEQGSRRSPALNYSSGNGATKLKPRCTLLALVVAQRKAQSSVLALRYAHEQLAPLTCPVVVHAIVQRMWK